MLSSSDEDERGTGNQRADGYRAAGDPAEQSTVGLGLPNILKRLGKMTAIRDTYLVEQSLLRTLGPLLGVLRTSLYRLDERGLIARALHYSRSVERDEAGLQRIVENIEEVRSGRDITKPMFDLFESVSLLGKPCSRRNGADLTMCYPLLGGDALCGYFVFERDHEATPAEAAMIVGVLEVFTNYYALLDTSQRDKLTGLFNRHSLELNLDRLWPLLSARQQENQESDARRLGAPRSYWFGVLDIDHFKKINDTYGHIIGDEVLIVVTRLLEKNFRNSDLLYRYGGEEFIAIIAADDLASAALAFERVRQAVDSFHFPQVGHVTLSCGYCEADPSVLPQEVISRADRALYEAKRDGRNRCHHYATLVQQGVLQEVTTGTIDLW
ncbi:MAG: GGDEF domain-containing protein [Burkholderiaceae bacterium]|nr:GGDEF domain-containing protein [Burkholderiaceae bacterium]